MDEPIVENLELCRDDLIEWILKSTNEDSDFRVYKTLSHISIHIDTKPFTP